MIRIRKPLLPFTLYKMLLSTYFYWFLIIQGLFVVILVIFDLFVKLDTYMNTPTSIFTMLQITALFIPKAIWQTLPISIMFSITMSLGGFYQNNELVAIFTSTISIYKFIVPLIVVGALMSFLMVFGDSYVVIPTFRQRERLYKDVSTRTTGNKDDTSNNDITIRGKNNYFWNVQKFTSSTNTVTNVIIFKTGSNYNTIYRLDAISAIYTKDGWLFKSGIIREWDQTGDIVNEERFFKRIIDFPERPVVFEKAEYDIENMTLEEASYKIAQLRELNIEHNKELTDYYKKFSFPLTLLIVTLFAIGVSTISRKNVMLLSLFFSLGLAIIYYVLMMILEVLATTGQIYPFFGAWFPIFLFLPIAIYLVNKSKT